MKPIRTIAPSALPVSLDDVKSHLRVFHIDDDGMLQNLIDGAVAELDGYSGTLGRAIIDQTWQQPFRGWSRDLCLPMPNARSVVLEYTDQDGSIQQVNSSLFEVVEAHSGSVVRLLTDFTAPSLKTDILQPINVTFTTGYGDESDVPRDIKIAIWLMVQLDYDQPDQQTAEAMRKAISAKVEKHRWVRV